MSDSSPTQDSFFGPNAGYVLALYDDFLTNPDTVDAETRAYFNKLGRPPVAVCASQPVSIIDGEQRGITIGAAAARLARFIRQRGHLEADVDPLGARPRHDAELALYEHGLTEADLEALPSSVVGGPIAEITSNSLEAINRLRQVYSGSIGYDDEHIQNKAERYWLRNAAESGRFFAGLDTAWKRDLLVRLTEVNSFEQYIGKTWVNEKRFSIEGCDMMVPMLDDIIHSAASHKIREVVLAMAHRGRLNVLAHVLGKPYEAIFSAFDDKNRPLASVSENGDSGYTGDVKYHLGYHRDYIETGIAEMPIALVPNPSHLEFVNAVAVGHARAAQENRDHSGPPARDGRASVAILIHGDAAFPGQGIVAETLNLSRLKGYSTDGAIHIIANNQIGFTTDPEDGRSTEYASDLAKGFEIPILHVNADDPVACIAAARMACEYRETFQKDFLIDLVGYRRYGHNEAENPEFTQPVMYHIVENHPRLREIWAARLAAEGTVSPDEATDMERLMQAKLTEARNAPVQNAAASGHTSEQAIPSQTLPEAAPVTAQQLIQLNSELLVRPDDFNVDPKLDRRVLQRRAAAINGSSGMDWGQVEALAFAVTLSEGTPIRLTGQDCERGTFGHRNAVLHDIKTGSTFIPLQCMPSSRASFAIYNSPLSENAALGFEYGYNVHAPDTLTIWEAQFGDFANGAQVIIDQFLASGMAKWQEASSVVMLLPHGYEGQGPEHSSARLERYLQIAANENICVVNCTTAAQFFHVLRRQVASLKRAARPLIVLTPKSLLRHPGAASSLIDLTHGDFQTVIDDADAVKRAGKVTRLILCSGKIYVDMALSNPTPDAPVARRPEFAAADRVALVRIEQLYPFPTGALREVVDGYPNLREIVWMQEEPKNMGAWTYMEPRLRDMAGTNWAGPILYAGRAEAASPAEGTMAQHQAEQSRILTLALERPPVFDIELTADAPIDKPAIAMETWGLGARGRSK